MAMTSREVAKVRKLDRLHGLELHAGVKKFEDGRNSDLLITCGPREWRTHKFILSAMSPVLERSCFGGFKESMESRLDLSIYTEVEVNALIEFIYTGNYSTKSDLTYSPLAFHVQMCIIANYFSMVGLERLATSQAEALIEVAGLDQVIEAAAVTATAPEPTRLIRKSIVQYALKLKDLYEGEDCAFSRLVAVSVELGTEIAREERAKVRPDEKRLECPNKGCGKTFIVACPMADEWDMRSCYYCNYRNNAWHFNAENGFPWGPTTSPPGQA